jgi:hypothetical protein
MLSSRTPNPFSSIRWAFVVLVPEDRQDDHRFAEVEGLGDGVVTAVGDEVDLGEDRGLGDGLGAGHVGASSSSLAWGPLDTITW